MPTINPLHLVKDIGCKYKGDFPTIEQLGSYTLDIWPVPLPVFQACLSSSRLRNRSEQIHLDRGLYACLSQVDALGLLSPVH